MSDPVDSRVVVPPVDAVPADPDRRRLLRGALSGVAGFGVGAIAGLGGCGDSGSSAGAGAGPAVVTNPKVRWRLASSFPRSLDTIFGSAEVLAERVKVLSGGNFEIRVYPAGELVPGLEVLDAVQNGTAQCGQTGSYYYIGKNPALAFDTCVPFGLTSRLQTAWLTQAGGMELVNQMLSDFGVRALPAGNTGVQMGGWFKGDVTSLEDLKGLKMRIPGMGGKVMSMLGVSVQNIAGGEIFTALERGAIDATDWVGPYDDEKLGFHKAAKYYCYPGWWEPGPQLSYYVQQSAWDALPAVYREIFTAAAQESAVVMQARYDARNPAALGRLIDAGVTLRPFVDEIMVAAREASNQMLVDDAAKDPAYRKVFDHWRKFRDESFGWFGLAELAYQNAAFHR